MKEIHDSTNEPASAAAEAMPNMERPFLSARSRAKWCAFFLVAYGIIAIAAMASTIAEISLLQRIESGAFVSEAEAVSNDERQATIAGLYFFAIVAAAITFFMWIYRTSNNLAALGWQDQRFSPGWAVGCWFVPIIGLFRPYQVVNEIWKGSLPGPRPETKQAQVNLPTSPLIGPWWAAWLVVGWIGNLVIRVYFSESSTVSDFIAADFVSVVADGIGLIALALVVTLIWQITANQERRHHERAREAAALVSAV